VGGTQPAMGRMVVLAVEDAEDDALLLRRAFDKAGLNHLMVRVANGKVAVDYLAGNGPWADRAEYPLPQLILSGLHMSVLDGFDLLMWLGTRPTLKHIPLVVLTSSECPSDEEKARQLGAAGYLVKPVGFEELTELVVQIHRRWLAEPSEISQVTAAKGIPATGSKRMRDTRIL
jgi:CheY-like chemotaxis protein